MAQELRQIGDALYWRYKLLEILIRNYKATQKIKWDAVRSHKEESCLISCKVIAADWKGVLWTRRWRQGGDGHRTGWELVKNNQNKTKTPRTRLDGWSWWMWTESVYLPKELDVVDPTDWGWLEPEEERLSGSWEDWAGLSCHVDIMFYNCSRMIKNTVYNRFSFFVKRIIM